MATVVPRPTSANAQIVFRVIGIVLLLVGLFLVVRGGIGFADEMNAAPTFDDDSSGFAPILMIGGGGFLFVFGIGALNAGFLGAQARYASREIAPAVREMGSAFRGESPGTAPVAPRSAGPFCSSCGVRADGAARFCDACGHELAPR